MARKKVFVTVGTTKFPQLISKITNESVIQTLLSLGYNLVQIQTGTDFVGLKVEDISLSYNLVVEGSSTCLEFGDRLKIKYDPYFDNFEQEIDSADLVISHAGAGTCLEVLTKQKPLIVVINEDLMDNHQKELAEELEKFGYLYYCNCDELQTTLKKDFNALKKYPIPEKHLFSDYLDKCVGLTNS